MDIPQVTLGYLVALAAIYSLLAFIVVVLRAKHGVPYGDGGNETLLHAIRAHGNFSEWIPLCVLLVGSLEALGQSEVVIHSLMSSLLVARILHPIALFSKVRSLMYMVGRIGGAFTSWLVLSGSAVLLAVRVW